MNSLVYSLCTSYNSFNSSYRLSCEVSSLALSCELELFELLTAERACEVDL